MTIAYCWRNGTVGFTDGKLPDGALILSKGNGTKWRDKVEVLCRLAYDNKTYLVPGVPEAEDDDDALNAVIRFRAVLEWALLSKNERGKTSWVEYVKMKVKEAA